MDQYLCPTRFFDFDDPAVEAWTQRQLAGVDEDPVAIARHLYLGVRDRIRYNPYRFSTLPESFSASYVVTHRTSYCIPKAVLLVAVARSRGIPARLGLADVRNHLSTPELNAWLGTNLFRVHGYVELFLAGRWVKATPAFDVRLCHFAGVEPLDFDGVNDSLFHACNGTGDRFMEYVNDYGCFADLPRAWVLEQLRMTYPQMFDEAGECLPFAGALIGKRFSVGRAVPR